MNSTIEYIRQLNQASVTVQSEWLERLRDVDAGPHDQVGTPEIVLSSRSSIPQYSEGDFTPPVTVVKRTQSQAATAPASAATTEVTPPAPAVQPKVNPIAEPAPQNATVQIPENTIQVISPADAQTLGAELFTSVADITVNTAIDFPTDSKQTATPQTFGIINEAEPLAAPSGTEDVTDSPTITNTQPEFPVEQPAIQQHKPQLESPAVLSDIVRPTIMPLRQAKGTDVIGSGISSQPIAPTTHPDPIKVHDTSSAGLNSESLPLAEAVNDDEVAPQQMVEMLADFGLPGDATSDTLSSEEMSELFPEADAADKAFDLQDPSLSSATRLCSFPDDKRSERFSYAKTKRQKLIDSIVDQIVERFAGGSHATIMLIGANREIDVDSAASRVATCLATREAGRILLVDGNLQSRQLTSLLGLTGEAGISNAFCGTHDVTSLICDTENSALKIIASGTHEFTGQPDEMNATTTTNQSLKNQFDYTIISGGVAGDPLSDAWSGVADGVYLIVDMDESDRATTISTVDYFRQLGARIVGCIATRA